MLKVSWKVGDSVVTYISKIKQLGKIWDITMTAANMHVSQSR